MRRTGFALAIFLLAMPAAAQTPVTWGAIADNGQGYYGIIAGMGTREAAEITALSECGSGCAVRLTAPERCVAYVHSPNGQASGYGAAATRQQAEQSAWNECSARVPSNSCELKGARCFE
ncbi:MAG: DUF4189 domain-containing protein [Reyranella sp.]|jgi:hypothetical protein|nr:MAG: DUF4189 domain-containing protein [Reyranella sp.]